MKEIRLESRDICTDERMKEGSSENLNRRKMSEEVNEQSYETFKACLF